MSYTTQLQKDLRNAFEDYGNEIFLDAAKALSTKNTRITELEALSANLKQEAQIHAMEARGANATINEINQFISGATGEAANWHGAQPVKDFVSDLKAQLSNWKALRTAIATGQPIWPNNWSQEVSMVAHEIHVKNTQLEAAKKDSARLDWIARQSLEDLSMSIVIDAPHDGEYCIVSDNNNPVYSKTFRTAIDAAISSGKA